MDAMLNVLQLGLDQLLERLRGPLNFRLVVMPTVVTVLALRAVWKDLRDGRPAFLGIWIQEPVERKRAFRSALGDVGKIFVVAVVLDTAFQVMVFRWVYPGMVLVVAFVCAVMPYVLVRGPVFLLAHHLFRKDHRAEASNVQWKKDNQ
ncbi:MAG: hypothetical protein IPO75_08375 [Betaproteobacteria bacterium]|nr:hypothetical protein [Betaproteobacteria bacterium]